MRERAKPFCIHQTECTYCSAAGRHADVRDISEIFAEVFETHFTDTSTTLGLDNLHCYEKGEFFIDIIEEIGAVSSKLANDIGDCLVRGWYDDLPTPPFNDDSGPCFTPKNRDLRHIGKEWRSIKEKLQQNRFYNEDVRKVLDDIFRDIDFDVDDHKNPVVIDVGPGHAINTVFRARVFQNLTGLEKALSFPEREFGPPPNGLGGAGRMNAQGQSVFYCATDPETTIAEVRPPVGSYITIVKFNVTKPLRILDLNRCQSVKLPDGSSLFDPNTIRAVERRDFLRQLARLISMPVLPDHQHTDYLITQVISDYLACSKELQLDGILYRSVQNGERTGQNIVIFAKSSRVANADLKKNTANVTMYLPDIDGNYSFYPQIEFIKSEPDEKRTRKQESSLELDRESIHLRLIKGVIHQWDDLKRSIC